MSVSRRSKKRTTASLRKPKRKTAFRGLLLRKFSQKRSQKSSQKISQKQFSAFSLTRRLAPKASRKRKPVSVLRALQFEVPVTETALVPVPMTQTPVVETPMQPVAAPPAPPQPADPTPGPEQILRLNDFIRPGPSLQSSIEGFLLNQRSEHTRRAYGKDLKRFVQFLIYRREAQGNEKLNRTVVIAYKEYLVADGLEHTTVDRHLATLKSFFGWLQEEDLIERNPADGVRFLKPKRVSPTNGFSDEEVRRVLALPDLHSRVGSLHYAVLMVLFYCGLRRSELCALRTSHLGYERGQSFLRVRGKGNSERIIPLIQPVVSAIFHYAKITQKDLATDQVLFSPVKNPRTGQTDKPLDPSSIFYFVVKYARQAGIVNRVSPHSCRATAISNARDHQVPDRAIQEFAGWSSTDMITRYDKRKTALEGAAAKSIRYGREDEASS